MRVLTWNINSLRLRLESLKRLVKELEPDVVLLQETKVQDKDFPEFECRALGFPHIAFKGMKSYNGVAILSHLPLQGIHSHNWCGKDDCRHISAEIEGVAVHCLYVPSGGDIPDPALNPKFAHKLDFLKEGVAWVKANLPADKPSLLAGDFNVAPLVHDVWSHKELLDVISHTPIETELLTQWQQSLPFTDAARHFTPEPEKIYTWWSYRAQDWKKSNRGRKLDHIWVSPALLPRLKSLQIFAEARDWASPSDHVPVMAEI